MSFIYLKCSFMNSSIWYYGFVVNVHNGSIDVSILKSMVCNDSLRMSRKVICWMFPNGSKDANKVTCHVNGSNNDR